MKVEDVDVVRAEFLQRRVDGEVHCNFDNRQFMLISTR